jgi:hypothetical protein
VPTLAGLTPFPQVSGLAGRLRAVYRRRKERVKPARWRG